MKKEYPKTFKELFAKTGIEPTTDENGNIQYNFKATMKEEPKQECKDCNTSLQDCTCIEDTIDMKQETLEESNQTTAIRFLEWYRRRGIIYQFHSYHIPIDDRKYLNALQLFEIFKKELYE